jgi:cytochrome c oxidase subunit 3
MSNQAATLAPLRKDWDGGVSPFGVSYGKLFMWIFLVSDALTFSSLLCAYGFMRHKYTGEWAHPNEVFHHFPFLEGKNLPLAYVGFMTFDLIMSSVTMVLAVEAGHRKAKKEVAIWLFFTIIGGLIFVGSQCWEWYHFITGPEIEGSYQGVFREYIMNGKHIVNPHFTGANLVVNSYTKLPTFGDFFFCITGFHGFHVFSGVIINIIMLLMVMNGVMERRGHYEMIEKAGLYWHFVDLVWVFVFTFFYLL